MTDYNNKNRNVADMMTPRTRPKPAAPELTKAAAMRMQRTRYGAMAKDGMNAAEMCRAMPDDELAENANRGGLAAIAEEAYRAGNIVMPDQELDLGV